MAPVIPFDEMVVTWGAWGGAPGYTVFRATPDTGCRPNIITFLQALLPYLPLNLTLTVPNSGKKIDASTGDLIGTWATGTTQTLTGTSTAQYAAPAGIAVTWQTNTLWRAHYIRGRTFFVPTTSASYQNDGTVLEAARTTIETAAQNLLTTTGSNILVWSRPKPNPVNSDDFGFTGKAITARVTDRIAVLRSRRA